LLTCPREGEVKDADDCRRRQHNLVLVLGNPALLAATRTAIAALLEVDKDALLCTRCNSTHICLAGHSFVVEALERGDPELARSHLREIAPAHACDHGDSSPPDLAEPPASNSAAALAVPHATSSGAVEPAHAGARNNQKLADGFRMWASKADADAQADARPEKSLHSFRARAFRRAAKWLEGLGEISKLEGGHEDGTVHLRCGKVLAAKRTLLRGETMWRRAVEAWEGSWRQEALQDAHSRNHCVDMRSKLVREELALVFMIGKKTARRLVEEYQVTGWEDLQQRLDAVCGHTKPVPSDLKPMVSLSLDLFRQLHEEVGEQHGRQTWAVRRIARAETAEIRDLVQQVCDSVRGPRLKVHATGSFRRGKADSGDIDLLIQPLEVEDWPGGLQVIVDELSSRGLLLSLVGPQARKVWDKFHKMHAHKVGYEGLNPEGSNPEVQQFMGFVRRSACQQDPCLWRRLDVWMYKKQHVPYGLLQCTGSGSFNPSLRLFAKRKRNMLLNQYGLFERELRDGRRHLVPGAVLVGRMYACMY